jgi:hypothetical protein
MGQSQPWLSFVKSLTRQAEAPQGALIEAVVRRRPPGSPR